MEQELNQTGAAAAPPAAIQEQAPGAGQVQQPAGDSQESKQVPLDAFERVRKEAQDSKAEMERLRLRTEILEQAAQQQQKQQGPAWDPEDVPLNKDVKRMVDESVGAIRADVRSQQVAIQEQQARVQHTDYDQVASLGIEMAKQIPGMADILLNTPNPAEAVYNFGKTHPSYLSQSQQQAARQVTEQINSNLNQPRTLSDAGGGGAPSMEVDWREKAGTAEMREKIEKVLRGIR